MSNKLLRKSDIGETNREVILSYLETNGVGVELNEKQQELLDRWSTADELIRKNTGRKKREEIANMLMAQFGITRSTAYHDIISAEYVYSSSKPINKKYLIGVRIEFVMAQIHAAQSVSDFIAVASLEKVLQGYISLYPDYVPEKSATTVIFNVTNNNLIQVTQVKEADVMEEADIMIKHLEENDDY